MELVVLLITTIIIMVGILLLTGLIIILYKSLYKHECTITYIRQGNRQIKKGRFRITKDKEKNEIIKTPLWHGKLVMPKPHESFFGIITKKRMYLEIIVPDNGQPYCIKPNFDTLGQIINYRLDDRDVMATCKQELRAGVHKYMYKNTIEGLIPLFAIIAMIIIVLFGGYWIQKMNKESVQSSRDMVAQMNNATRELANAIIIYTQYQQGLNGSMINPIVLGGSS